MEKYRLFHLWRFKIFIIILFRPVRGSISTNNNNDDDNNNGNKKNKKNKKNSCSYRVIINLCRIKRKKLSRSLNAAVRTNSL